MLSWFGVELDQALEVFQPWALCTLAVVLAHSVLFVNRILPVHALGE